ncbi:MAG: LemA family protein [Clostridia bacterium]|nr:LemA family protein [Clostridia bacterium]
MKKTWIILAVIAVVVLLIVGTLIGGYNSLVDMQESVDEKASVIQTQLQRRADLIPNFVETVKGYATHEEETFTAVTEARNALANASGMEEQANAEAQLDSAIDIWVNAVTESYPELKANTNFIALQDELAGTENRIATARNDYNEAAKKYNSTIRKFPTSITASMFGFEKAEYFEAQAGTENAPSVSFE